MLRCVRVRSWPESADFCIAVSRQLSSVRRTGKGDDHVELARKKPGTVLFSLNHVIDFEWTREAYIRTRKDGATGIDGVTAQEYEDAK